MLPNRHDKSKTGSLSEDSKRALTHLNLEDITPSPELLADMHLLDAGKITKKEFIGRALARAKS